MTPGFALNLPSGGPIPIAGLFTGGQVSASQTVSGEFLELLAPLLGGAPPDRLDQNAPPAGTGAKTRTAGAAHGDSDSQQRKPQKNDDDDQPAAPIPCLVPPTAPILPNPIRFPLWATSTAAEPLTPRESGSEDSPAGREGTPAPAASSPPIPSNEMAAMPAVDPSSPGSETASASAESPELKRERQAEFLADSAAGNTGSAANPASGATSESGAAERPHAGLAFGARLVPAEDNPEQPAPAQGCATAARTAPAADGAEPGLPPLTALETADSRRQLPQAPAGGLAEMSIPASDGTPGGENRATAETGRPRAIPGSYSSTWASAQEPSTGAPAQPVLSRIVTGIPAAGDSVNGGPAASQVKSEPSPSTGSETKTAAATQTRDLAGSRVQSVDFATDPGVTARRPALPDSAGFAKLAGPAAWRNPRQPFQPAAGEVSSQEADSAPEPQSQATVETGQPSAMPPSYSSAWASAPAQPVLSRMVTGRPAAGDSSVSGNPIASQVKGERSAAPGSDTQAATVETRGQREDRAQPVDGQTESGAAAPPGLATPASQPVPLGEVPAVHAPSAPASVPRTPAKADPPMRASATVPEAAVPAERATAVKSTPASEISLSVPGRNQDGVQVRVVERAGEVHVTVRTPDGELARDLRQDLSQLVARLEQKGYQAETWRPSGHADTLSQARQPQRGAASENPSGNSGGAEEHGGGRRGSSQQQKGRPRWLQEMEQTFGQGQ